MQTISWGQHIPDIAVLAKAAGEIGYQGLEFAQRIDALCPAQDMRHALGSCGLQCIGLAGGALDDRIEYGAELGVSYLLQMEWDERAIRLASDRGLRVALHPHWHKGIDSLTTAEQYLTRYPDIDLGLVLDTAHLFLAGESVLDAFDRHSGRIVAVHLKDWTSRYGTSPFRFAKGFVPLGQGELSPLLEEVTRHLRIHNYK
ncbi:MAG: sugar phosphate isomerase/epimerase, partial [Deltaproteobacteria bacterium]|nr:sugar phosphate isomerase/epimerase [Deltaproteobacteria bacterium]